MPVTSGVDKLLSQITSLETDCFTVNEHKNICIAGLNHQAGYATACQTVLRDKYSSLVHTCRKNWKLLLLKYVN